ncbi:MAG: competence/damage-inducible protein A [Acidobacteria bacterium]|nr:competence/damage-inducible protein A [Acidobacteriota bacterium]
MTATPASSGTGAVWPRAAIIAVGSELLGTSRLDTNSLLITERLNALGIEVAYKSVVGDDRAQLTSAVRFALDTVGLVICCGGLGPTDDDLTRAVVAGVLSLPLVEDESITERIRELFASRRMEMPAINRRQAMVPAGARVLDNPRGTAPGLWIEDGDRAVLLLPGPPRELTPMLAAAAEDLLRERSPDRSMVTRVVRITGRTESHTEEAVQPLYAEWARADVPVSPTILASLGQIELHLTAQAASTDRAAAAAEAAAAQVVEVLGPDVYSVDGRPLEQVVGERLAERRWRIALAESCTGGLLTSRLTDVPGSSRYVETAVVAYANSAKVSLLGVPQALLDEHGAVSEPVAIAMADGVRTSAGADIGVGVTGIAGPDGGSAHKPVGTVAIAVAFPGSSCSRMFRFIGGREQVKFQASQAALDMVRRQLAR